MERGSLNPPRSAIKWGQKGYKLLRNKRFEEAIECFDKAIGEFRDFVEVWHFKAVALGFLYRFYEAIKCLDTIIEIDPKN
nr:tetratricopeptide repeat protein [Candidatus Njordarchaeum guaymaensis]